MAPENEEVMQMVLEGKLLFAYNLHTNLLKYESIRKKYADKK